MKIFDVVRIHMEKKEEREVFKAKLKPLFFRSRSKVTFQPLGGLPFSYISVHAHEKTMDYSKLATPKEIPAVSARSCQEYSMMSGGRRVANSLSSERLRVATHVRAIVSPLHRADFFRARRGIVSFNSPISFVQREMLSA